jgi:hypothetical protein
MVCRGHFGSGVRATGGNGFARGIPAGMARGQVRLSERRLMRAARRSRSCWYQLLVVLARRTPIWGSQMVVCPWTCIVISFSIVGSFAALCGLIYSASP